MIHRFGEVPGMIIWVVELILVMVVETEEERRRRKRKEKFDEGFEYAQEGLDSLEAPRR